MSTENSERDYKDPLRSYNPATSVILVGYRPRLSEYSVKVPLFRTSTFEFASAYIFTMPENIKWLSGEDLIQRFELPEAERFMKQFCSKCGSGVPYVNRLGTKLVIPAGSLTEQFKVSPGKNIFWESRAKWYESGLKTPRHDEY